MPHTSVANVGLSTSAAAAGQLHIDPDLSRNHRRASPTMASPPAYSDGLPYPEPKVVRRPVSRAVGWITSNLRRDRRRIRDSEKGKNLPSEREQKSEKPLSRVFKRNWYDNALQVRESGRTLSSFPRSAATFSNNTAGSLTSSSSSSISDGGGRCSPAELTQPLFDVLCAPSSPHQLHMPILKPGTRPCNVVNPSEPTATEHDPFIDFTQDMDLSRYGSCRDIVQEDNNGSGLARDSDTRLLQQHLPGVAVDAGLCLADASPADVGIVLPEEQVARPVNQSHSSVANLSLHASLEGMNPTPARKEVERRYTSDPTNAVLVSLQQRCKEHATQPVDQGAPRPLSLCTPVEQSLFGDSWSSQDLAADRCNLPLDPLSKGRLLAAVSTMDIRTPPTSIKVVRPSASYVDVHVISKMDSEDVSCGFNTGAWD